MSAVNASNISNSCAQQNSSDWLSLYENMKDGKVNYNSNFYVSKTSNEGTTSQEGDGDIKLVTPTQAQVEQAKVEMKRKLPLTEIRARAISSPKKRKMMNGRGSSVKRARKNSSKKRAPIKKSKSSGQKGGAKKRRVRKRRTNGKKAGPRRRKSVKRRGY